MGQAVSFQETLRKLTVIDEGFVEGQVRLGLGLATAPALDPETAALLRLGTSVAIGSPGACLEWCAGRALAAGAAEEEIADALVAIAPVAGLARVAAADVATALGYDTAARPGDWTMAEGSSAGHVGLAAGTPRSPGLRMTALAGACCPAQRWHRRQHGGR